MTDFVKIRKDILKLVDQWVPRMDLEWFIIRHEFSEAEHDGDPGCLATTQALWCYRDAKITWYLPKLALCSPEYLENVIVHELCHILIDSIAPVDQEVAAKDSGKNNELEFATECVARAILTTWKVRRATKRP